MKKRFLTSGSNVRRAGMLAFAYKILLTAEVANEIE
jgi:hypothetical protein